MTTNQPQSFNCVLKQLHDWKEAPIDATTLMLFHLTQFQMTVLLLWSWRLRASVWPQSGWCNGQSHCDFLADRQP